MIKVHIEWKQDGGNETKQRTIIHAADGQRALGRDHGGEIQKRAIILSRGGFYHSFGGIEGGVRKRLYYEKQREPSKLAP